MANAEICASVFRTIVTRQTEALMFHDSMIDLFEFLGLEGYKAMHEHQYFSESAERRVIKEYYIETQDKLVELDHLTDPRVVPEEWSRYTRFDVTPQVRKSSVEKAFEEYDQWECDTKDIYESCAKQLLEAGCLAEYDKVMELIRDVTDEIRTLELMLIDLRSVSFDAVHIADLQPVLVEKYS